MKFCARRIGRIHNSLAGERLIHHAGGHVGHQGNAQDAHAAMVGRDRLRYGAHAHGVAPQGADGPDLRRGLILRARHIEIYALGHILAQACGYLPEFHPQARIEYIGHIREAGAEFFKIGPHQGAAKGELDVIFDQHQLAAHIIRVYAPGGVGYDEGFDAQQPRYPHWVGHLLHGVALVGMEASLHQQGALAAQDTRHETARVAHSRASLEIRYLPIRDIDGALHLFRQAA